LTVALRLRNSKPRPTGATGVDSAARLVGGANPHAGRARRAGAGVWRLDVRRGRRARHGPQRWHRSNQARDHALSAHAPDGATCNRPGSCV